MFQLLSGVSPYENNKLLFPNIYISLLILEFKWNLSFGHKMKIMFMLTVPRHEWPVLNVVKVFNNNSNNVEIM